MGLVPPEFCDFNPDCPIGRSSFVAGRSRAIAVSILHRVCSIADCLTLLQRTCPDETTSHSTRLSDEELLAGHPKDVVKSLVMGLSILLRSCGCPAGNFSDNGISSL